MTDLSEQDSPIPYLFFRRTLRLPRRLVRESIMIIQLIQFFLINRMGSKAVTEPGGPVVSLTTYGGRCKKVYYAIESIAHGQARPSRLILWIDDEVLLNNLPATIRRLQKRGLEVKSSRNYGPHTKYYPYLESTDTFDVPLVTADDDMFYPRYWLKKLVEANLKHPNIVSCYFSHVIPLSENGFERYRNWELCISTDPSFRHIAAGVTGVIYPPTFLAVLKHAGTAFETCCPRGDDLWLHVQALRTGHKVRQVLPRLPYFAFHGIPGTQQTALCHENVDHGDGNDRQMKATYTEADFQILRSERSTLHATND
jgi:hypothetical protein